MKGLITVLQKNKFNINEIELSFADPLSLVDHSKDLVNTKDFFENGLVAYLQANPAYVKADRAAEFDAAAKRFTEVLPRMEETVQNRQQIPDNEDPWQYRIATLDQGFQKWDNFKKNYDRFTHEEVDDLDRKKLIANVFCQYLKLIRNAAILISRKEAAVYKDELGIFWHTKRENLHAAIISKLKKKS